MNCKITLKNLIMNKMNINFDVFSATMKTMINCKCTSAEITTPQNGLLFWENPNFFKKLSEPYDLNIEREKTLYFDSLDRATTVYFLEEHETRLGLINTQ